MPFPLALAAGAITAGSGILSTVLNNRAQRRLSMDMYNLQRKDALADWDRQNTYNSPAAQMQRFKDAGLNPNLIYGQTNEAPAVRTTPMDVPNLKPMPVPDLPGLLMGYTQMKAQEAQTDLTRKAIENANLEGQLKIAQIVKTYMDVDTKSFDLGLKKDLRETAIETAYKQLEGLQGRNALQWQSLEQREKSFPLQQAMKEANLKVIGQELLLKQAQTAKSWKDQQKISAEIRNLDRLDFEARMTQDERIKVAGILNRMMEKKIKGQDISNEIEDFRRSMMQVDKGMQYFNSVIGAVGTLSPVKPR